MNRKQFFNILFSDIKRSTGVFFWLAIFAVALCILLDSWGTFVNSIGNPLIYHEKSGICVQYFYFEAVSFGGVFSQYFSAILAAIPAVRYCLEHNNNVVIYKMLRSNLKNYATSKMLVAALCGGGILFLGRLLAVLGLSTYMPWITLTRTQEMKNFPYYDGLLQNNALGYFIAVLYLSFLSGALWGSFAMCVSAFFPNPYVTVCSPIFINFFLVECGRLLDLSPALRLDMILNARGLFLSDSVTLLVATLAVVMLTLVNFRIFQKRVVNRIENAA